KRGPAGGTAEAAAHPATGSASTVSSTDGAAPSANSTAPTMGGAASTPGAAPAGSHHVAHQARMKQAHEDATRRRAEHRARRPSAAFVSLSLGLAVIGGALASLMARVLGWPQNTLLLGLA